MPSVAARLPVEELVGRLTAPPHRAGRLTHLEVLAAREGQTVPWPRWADQRVVSAWQERGIARPWAHQAEAAQAAYRGEHVVVATGTASGKSLAFQLPALTRVLAERRPNGRPGASVLYLSPTKALAQDQLSALSALAVPGLAACCHDGDTPREQRDWAREHAEYLLTNPDMLHHSLLPGHARWARFLGQLAYVVVDECHHYRGVFGAHVALVLRRLRRLCGVYGAEPTFVLASATVADPAVSGERLTGLRVRPVTQDASARGRVALGLWEPPLVPQAGRRPDDGQIAHGGGVDGDDDGDDDRDGEADSGADGGSQGARPEGLTQVRRSATAEVADLLADLVADGVCTLAFVRSRRGAETVALSAGRLLDQAEPGASAALAAYRGGYLPEERRELESALRDGRLVGVAATNALELGIDVAGLDAVLMAGFPGTRSAMWQQIGRAGRAGADALALLVARDDPLDTYLVHHPDALVAGSIEATVFDPGNPHVLGPHLCAAAAEVPLTEPDLSLFGPTARDAVDALAGAGLLRRRSAGWYWTARSRPSDLADLRSAGGRAIELVEGGTGTVVGTVDAGSAHATVHTGAVYLHRGETYVVEDLDLEDHVALMHKGDPGYVTSARDLTDITVLSTERRSAWGAASLSFGTVQVTRQVVSYLARRAGSGEVLGEAPLDLPERVLETRAVWWTVPAPALEAAGLAPADLPGAAHAAEHASIGLLPLLATCDRWDIGGVSTALHPQTGALTVFVHDGQPGGAGFAEHGFRVAPDWLRATREAIASCRCEVGCPACVQSPKCGSGNAPLDKHGAVRLLDVLLSEAPPAST